MSVLDNVAGSDESGDERLTPHGDESGAQQGTRE
jgi:hypothetical protein